MLRELYIRNLAIIDEVRVEFDGGLNALTGETGAGKSIIVDSLSLLAGSRASNDLIRTGADRLVVTGVFEPEGEEWRTLLRGAGLESRDEEGLIIRREVALRGANRVFVNDQPVTLRLLTDLAPFLIQIHGQREEAGLVGAAEQRGWLDACGGAPGEILLQGVADRYSAWRTLADRLGRLTGDRRTRVERIDLLRFQLREIDQAAMTSGEDDELRAERETLRYAETILENLGAASTSLSGDEGAAHRLVEAERFLSRLREVDPSVVDWMLELEELAVRSEELTVALRNRLDEVEVNPGKLDSVELRLVELERLFRKYGGTCALVLEERERLAGELAELETDAEGLENLEVEVAEALEAYRVAAKELSTKRRQWGEWLSERVCRELSDLAMPHARLVVDLALRVREDSPLKQAGQSVEFGLSGFDRVRFLFSPNPGEDLRPLARAASGGELARLFLGLRLTVRDAGSSPDASLVFDEIDAGVGGREAAALGAKLQRMAEGSQLFVVTHLPQVASYADRHLRIQKEVDGERTRVRVGPVAEGTRVEELARMLAGERVTNLSLDHARELLVANSRT